MSGIENTSLQGVMFHCGICSEDIGDWDLVEMHPCFASQTQLCVAQDGAVTAGTGSDSDRLVTPAPQNLEEDSVKLWTNNETVNLIKQCEKHLPMFRQSKKAKDVWEKIAERMKILGIEVTGHQCSSKWRSLLRTYRTVLTNKKTIGRGTAMRAVRFQHFDILYNMLGDKPPFNGHVFKSDLGEHILGISSSSFPSETETLNAEERLPRSLIDMRKLDTLILMLQDYFNKKQVMESERRNERKKWQQERREKAEAKEKRKVERHKQKMKLQERKLDLLATLLAKK